MNYLAALILVGVGMDEDAAFKIFVALLEDTEHDLKKLYSNRLIGLTEIA